MRSLLVTLRRPLAFALPLLAASSALAHPGHDGDHGGGLTWDFVGEVVHRLVHPYHVLPVLAVAGLIIWALRSTRADKKEDRRD